MRWPSPRAALSLASFFVPRPCSSYLPILPHRCRSPVERKNSTTERRNDKDSIHNCEAKQPQTANFGIILQGDNVMGQYFLHIKFRCTASLTARV